MKTPIERIPHDFVAADGKPLFSLIEMLTGRSVPKGGDSQTKDALVWAVRIKQTSQEKALDAAKMRARTMLFGSHQEPWSVGEPCRPKFC